MKAAPVISHKILPNAFRGNPFRIQSTPSDVRIRTSWASGFIPDTLLVTSGPLTPLLQCLKPACASHCKIEHKYSLLHPTNFQLPQLPGQDTDPSTIKLHSEGLIIWLTQTCRDDHPHFGVASVRPQTAHEPGASRSHLSLPPLPSDPALSRRRVCGVSGISAHRLSHQNYANHLYWGRCPTAWRMHGC